MYDETLYLVSKVNTGQKDEYGDPIYEEVLRDIFVEVKSIGRSEFYQAQTAGYKPEIMFETADYLEYDNENEVIFHGIRYSVLRTYRKGIPLEIVCYGGVRDEHSTFSN